MKQILSLAVILLSVGLQAQLGVNTDDPKGSLEVRYRTGGINTQQPQTVLFPQVSTDQREGWDKSLLEPGMMIYNTNKKCLEMYRGLISGTPTWSCTSEIQPASSGSPTPKATATLGSIDPLQWFAMEYNSTYYNSLGSTVANNGSISVEIPYSNATNGDYDAYEQTFTLVDKNDIPRQFKLSYPAGTITQATGTITATLTNISGSTYNPPPQPTPTSAQQYHDLATVQVSFNGAGTTPMKIQATGGIPDKKFGDGAHDFVYLPVEVNYGNGVTKTWLNMNLGAEAAKVGSRAFNPMLKKTGDAAHQDANLYGSLYQWQRPTDGHEFRNSPTIKTRAYNWQATSPSSIVGKFIATNNENWVSNGENTSYANLELWQSGKPNNPCPTGYHVPTRAEWEDFHKAVKVDGGSSVEGELWNQTLLPNFAEGGIRFRGSDPAGEGVWGVYWSADWWGRFEGVIFEWGERRRPGVDFGARADGYSVRCLKD